MILTKVWSENTAVGMVLLSNDPNYFDGFYSFYFDQDNLLRMFVSSTNYPESSSEVIAYYNKEGELMHISFYRHEPEGYSYQGIAYKTQCEVDSIYYKYNIQYEMMGEFEKRDEERYDNHYSLIIEEWDILKMYSHTGNLQSYFKIKSLIPPEECKKVQFRMPQKNEITYVNKDKVNVREQRNTSSKVISILDIGARVKILDILQEESIKGLGTYNWYKVEINNITGYIFGAFLEPVEKEVKK
jgi:uncharacterized protein YgiM (DUF1202 family)